MQHKTAEKRNRVILIQVRETGGDHYGTTLFPGGEVNEGENNAISTLCRFETGVLPVVCCVI